MKAYLGLGSNVGDKVSFIQRAITKLKETEGIEVTNTASLYETEPWGKQDQDLFINSAVEIETDLTPEELFVKIKDIEKELERRTNEKWAEREIDIDILFYDGKIVKTDRITIPHAQIENRRFVLVPMNELAPDLIHPELKKTIKELLESTKDILEVKKYIQ